MGFNIYTEMFDQLSAALAGVIATYAGVIGWISGPLRVGVTIYIILLGFAILRSAVLMLVSARSITPMET